MAPLVTRLVTALDPRGRELGACLSCGAPVRDGHDFVRAPRGGYSHAECATYRMRQGARPRRWSPYSDRRDPFTGD
ncbi:MAG: hypothetical protein QOK25_1467 [Thermoleophilaceae bacterium]|jgi:hypothetical protein|nr:hypothetical protein [Thermoleophilaceae bacterium]